MVLTKAPQTPQASATNAAGATTTGSAQAIGYGVSGVARVANGGTGPTAPCQFILEVSPDGGTTWREWSRQAASTTAGASADFPFALGIGAGGDMTHYRVAFSGNDDQDVTVGAVASSTTAI